MKKQIWLSLLIGLGFEKYFKSDWFLALGYNANGMVENGDTINFSLKGLAPTVYKNWNFSADGQLPVQFREDMPESISLDTYHTSQQPLPRFDIDNLPYDKKDSVLQDSRNELINSIATEGLWHASPYENTGDTPLVVATGAVGMDGKKLVTTQDIANLRTKLNKQYPRLKDKRWVLIIDEESYQSIAENSTVAKYQAGWLLPVGQMTIPQVLKIHGFEIVADSRQPYYSTGVASTANRLAYGSVLVGTEAASCVAVCQDYTFLTATGNVTMEGTESDAGWHGSNYSFGLKGYIGPFSNDTIANVKYTGAILRGA